MAEIKIEKKKPIWPWVIVILIILAAIYFFWYYNDRNYDTNDDMMENDTITQLEERDVYNDSSMDSTTLYTGSYGTVKKEQSIVDYLGFVDKQENSSTDKDYYRTAFFKLITATKREAEIANVEVTQNIESAMKNAEMLTNDPATTQKTDKIRMAAQDVSKALKSIQQQKFSNLSTEADAVNDAAGKIETNGNVEAQQTNIDAFFDKSAILLQRMYAHENDNQ